MSSSRRSNIVGDSASAGNVQQVFKSTFNAMINEDYSIGVDAEEYQSVLEHSISKANFSVGTDIYMLPSNINLNVRKSARYNNKILISNRNMKNRLNRNMSKAEVYHQKCFLSRYQRTRKKHMRPPC